MRKLAVGLAASVAPAAALACATCARDEGSGTLLLVGGMIVAPYVVAALVIRAIRGAGAEP
jgi:hypothetical protein